MIYLLAVPVAALIWAWLDLFAFNAGAGFRYRQGLPDEVAFRVRRNSWLVRLVNPPKGGRSSGMAVGDTIHLGIGAKRPSAWLIAHEFAHILRSRGRVASYLWRYTTSPTFRKAEEAACDAWAWAHYGDWEFGAISRYIAKAEGQHTEEEDA
jgi:hypothetical protein